MAKGGTAVVIDTETGEILAMANVDRDDDGVARGDLGQLAAVTPTSPARWPRSFTSSAALERGPDHARHDDRRCPRYLTFDKGTKWQHGSPTPSRTAPSPMTAAHDPRRVVEHRHHASPSEQLGVEQAARLPARFGFGAADRPRLPRRDRRASLQPIRRSWQGTEKVTITYGQGFAATALQLAAAVNTIANDGVYVAPKLVKATIDADGERDRHGAVGHARGDQPDDGGGR